jgi:putative DNA primase/helicase
VGGLPVVNCALPWFVGSDTNNFVAISTFRKGADGKYHRRKENFAACHLIMVDDVGTKIQPCQIPLEPSYKLETSPGNYQYGYLLAAPGLDGDLIARVIDAMIAQGLAADGKDPGMKGVTRYGCLPVGWNTKAKYIERLGAPFVHQLEEWHPDRRFTLQEIIEAFELDLDRAHTRGGVRVETDDSILKVLEAKGLVKGPVNGKAGVWDIVCPWVEEHTDRADSGAAYFQAHFDGRDTPGYRCHHGHCESRTIKDLLRFLKPEKRAADAEARGKGESTPPEDNWQWPEGATDNPEGSSQSELVMRCVADVETTPVRWLWKDRIALGKITFLVGDPDEGKSCLTTALAAHVTTGNPWPDGAPCDKGSVILISAEDDMSDTIRPRLEACGAELAKVRFIEAVKFCKRGKKGERLFSVQEDLHALGKTLDKLGDVRLVVIDPISAFLGECDSHVNAEVRGLMGPFAKLAAKHNAAFLAISHLNKGEGNALYRITGSLAFVALARAAFLLTHDKEQPERRLLLRIKNNLSPLRSGLAFSIVSNERGLPVLAWEPDPIDMTANDALAPAIKGKGETKLEAAEKWLREVLANGPVLGETIEKDAEGLGISTTGVLRRAKKALGVKSRKQTFSGKWEWVLPTPGDVCTPSTDTASDKTSSEDEQRTPSSEAKQNADSSEGVQTAPGVGKNGSEEGSERPCPPGVPRSSNPPAPNQQLSETAERILAVIDETGRIIAGESVASHLGMAIADIEPHLNELAAKGVIAPKGVFWQTSPVRRVKQ